MAEFLRKSLKYSFSRSLFRKEDGSPIVFYSEEESDDLQSIIQKGGGYLTSNPEEADVKLCAKRTDNRITQGYLPFKFIADCVKDDEFLSVEYYRATTSKYVSSSSSEESLGSPSSSEEEGKMVAISEPARFSLSSKSLGRTKYTDADDIKIIEYLINHEKYSETGGNTVWKQMALVKVTEHSYQSMKARFLKQILPQIDFYNISADWKSKLLKDYSTDNPQCAEGLNEEVADFDDIDGWRNKENMLKRCGDTKKSALASPSRGASAKHTLTSEETLTGASKNKSKTPSTQDSSPVTRSRAAEVNSNGPEQDLLTEGSSDKLKSVQIQDLLANYYKAVNGHADNEDSSLSELLVCTEMQSNDYMYDEMDFLIMSEANRNKNLDGADKSEQSSVSNAIGVTRRHEKTIKNCASDDGSVTKIRNVCLHSHNSKSGREVNTGKALVDNNPRRIATSSSVFGEKSMTNQRSPDRQKVSLDGQVEVCDGQNNSVNKVILNSFDKGSSNSETRKSSISKDSEQKNVGSDNPRKRKREAREGSKNDNSRSVSPEIELVDSHHVMIRQDKGSVVDKNSDDQPENSCLIHALLNKENKRTLRNSVSRSQVNSADQIETISVQHTNSVSKILSIIDEGPSSKLDKRSVSSKNSSCDLNSSESDSPSKRKCTRQLSPTAGPSVSKSAGDKSDTRLPKEGWVTTTAKDVPSEWISQESTKRRVKYIASKKRSEDKRHPCHTPVLISNSSYLSEEYGLNMNEAAYLLWVHGGSFLSVLKFFES